MKLEQRRECKVRRERIGKLYGFAGGEGGTRLQYSNIRGRVSPPALSSTRTRLGREGMLLAGTRSDQL